MQKQTVDEVGNWFDGKLYQEC